MAESAPPPANITGRNNPAKGGSGEKPKDTSKTSKDVQKSGRGNNRRGKKGPTQQQDGNTSSLNEPNANDKPLNNTTKKQGARKGKNKQRSNESNNSDKVGNNNKNNNHRNNRQKNKKGVVNQNEGNANNDDSNNNPSKTKKKRKKKNSKQSEEAKKKAAALKAAKEEAAREQARKAAQEKAIAEAKAKFEAGQAKIIQDKENRLQTFQEASSLLSSLSKQSQIRQQSRDILLSPEKLSELRSDHQKLKKTLKSDVKKCTAFCRKVKVGGWDSSPPRNNNDYAIVKDIKTLNLSRYVEEVASALMEAKFKMTDLPVVVALCKAMHERYEDFLPALMPKLVSILKAKDTSSSSATSQQNQLGSQSNQNGDNDDSGGSGGGSAAAIDRAKEASRQRRMSLKLLVEFVMNGLIGEMKVLMKIIAEATGAPSSATSLGAATYTVTDANIIISFAKAINHEILGNPSRSVQNARALLERETIEIIKMEEEINTKLSQENKTQQNDSSLGNTSVLDATGNLQDNSESPDKTITDISAEDLINKPNKIEYKPNPKINELDLEIIALAKESSQIPIEEALLLRAMSHTHSNILRAHCQGAYQFFCTSLTTTHTKLQKLEKRCEQDRLLVGTLSEAREKGLSDAKKMLETLRNRVEVLAEILDEDAPVLNKDDNNDEDAVAGSGEDGVGLMLWTKEQDENGEGGGNLGPYDDEDARSFYCDVPDLLTTIPPALLGLTQDDVERISSENIKKYGGMIDEDEPNEDEDGEPASEIVETSEESNDPNKVGEEASLSIDDQIEHSNEDNDDSSDKDKDTPHYKLTILLEQELPECNRRESTDILAEKFCNNHGASKSSRKRLSKALFLIPRTRLDLLPYYARVAAILQRVYPSDIGPPLIQELEAQFHGLARWKKNQNLEGRIKNARFIGELTKFRAAPPIVSLRCLRRCLDDFNGYNIDIACCLLECCGRYLYRMKHTNKRITDTMDTMMRIKKAKHLDDRAVALIDSAFFMVRPPTNPVRKQSKVLPPIEAYLKHLFMVRLSPQSETISFVAKQLQRLPWSDSCMDCGSMVCKYMLKACRKGRFMAVQAVAEVAAALRRSRPEISSRIIDSVLEELQSFMETPNFRDQQRVLVMSRLLGELHNAAVVPTSLIFDQLHHFINFGHSIPDALRKASEKEAELKSATGETNDLMPKSLLSQQRDISLAIPEDEELEEELEEKIEENKLDDSPPPENATVVAVSLHSQYDPRVPCSIDAPNAVARIKQVCTLLESMVSNIVASSNLSKLHHFLASFQRYLFTKSVLPTEVEFSILDLFDSLDSALNKNNGKTNQSSKLAGNGITRYTNWLDAHNATIAAEEAEAAAEARAKARLLAVGGADEAAIANIDEDEKEELENSDVMSDDEDEIDDESVGENISMNSDESEESVVGSIDSEEIDSEDETEDESDSESGSGESDVETDVTDDDMYIDEDEEEEIDEATAQEMYMRQLEEEAFERELRKITIEAIEKGKIAARTGKIADNMVHASQFVGKKNDGTANSTGDDTNTPKTALGGEEGVNFKLLKRGHKGRVEAKHFLVPTETNLARQATKQDDEKAREREALKARVLQYEAESAEQQYSGNVYMDQTKLQVIRNRPLSMEDIDRNFGHGGNDYSYPNNNSRWPNSSSERHRSSHHGGRGGGRGRGGRSLRFY